MGSKILLTMSPAHPSSYFMTFMIAKVMFFFANAENKLTIESTKTIEIYLPNNRNVDLIISVRYKLFHANTQSIVYRIHVHVVHDVVFINSTPIVNNSFRSRLRPTKKQSRRLEIRQKLYST